MNSRATLCLWRQCSRSTSQRLGFRCYSSHSGTSPELFDVVCVGGGPAGLTLLSALRSSPATSGLKVALVEGLDLQKSRLTNPTPTIYSNRCSSLTPASVKYLKDIGAWRFIDESRIQPYDGMEVWDGVTDSRITFDWDQTSGLFGFETSAQPAPSYTGSRTIAYMIENLNLTTGLQNFLADLGGVTILSPSRVESIQYGLETESVDLSSWPTVTVSGGRTLAARLLIGADGANSPVRTFAGINARGWNYDRMGVVATIQLASEPARKVAYQRFLPSGPIAMLPLPGNMASLVWSTTPERAQVLKSLSGEDFVAMVNGAFRLSTVDIDYFHSIGSGQAEEFKWRTQHSKPAGPVPTLVAGVQEGTVAGFPLRLRHADNYTTSRVALIGDAAHTIHPLAGQGLNLGQGDVQSLVGTISAALESGHDIGSSLSLEQYDSERYAFNHALMGVCDKLHKLYAYDSGPVVGLRSLGLSAINGIGWAKGLLMKNAAGGA